MSGSPVEYLRSLFPPDRRRIRLPIKLRDEEELDRYKDSLVRLIRAANVEALRAEYKEGASFEASNRNGETFLHLACRRGSFETVQFLLDEVGLSPNERDNLGRSILHDVCWKSTADLKLMDYLIHIVSPEMLLMEDERGDGPFDYARRDHWVIWTTFLQEREDLLRRRIKITCS